MQRAKKAEESFITAARTGGRIDMSLPGSKIRSLQAEENLLIAARNGGKIDMSLPESRIRRQTIAQVRGSSVEELAARGAAKSLMTFAATEDDKYLDVMRREDLEAAGKILHDYSDRSAIASIVKETPPDKEMRMIQQQVRQCLKEVINDLGYRPAQSEQTHWRTHNPGAFSHLRKRDIPLAIRRRLLAIHVHKQKLTIISGLSLQDAHTIRCYMQEQYASVFSG